MKCMKKLELLFLSLVLSLWSALAQTPPQVVRTPDYRFANLAKLGYPWPPNYFDLNISGKPPLRMHYLDIDPGNAKETILLLHGTPTWSFLFRKMIPPLAEQGYRLIVPDFIGYGRSDKLTNIEDYSHDLHLQSLLGLLEHLNLQDFNLWAHDLSGMVGLSAVRLQPFRFKRLILYNTWIPQGDMMDTIVSVFDNAAYLAYRLGITKRFGLNHPVEELLTSTAKISTTDLEGYTAPCPGPPYRSAMGAWPQIVPRFFNDTTAIEMRKVREYLLSSWDPIPVLYGWGELEPFTIKGAHVFREVFRDTGCEVNLANAVHFIPDDDADRLVQITIKFLNGGCDAVAGENLATAQSVNMMVQY